MKKFINLLMLLLASFNTLAASNSNPGLYYGQVPTAAQWNSYFSSKLDYSPGAANTLPYWDGSGNLLAAPVTGGCSFAAGVFTCSPINLAGGTVGAIPYQSAPDTTLFLSGNTTTTPQFVTSTGTGAAAQAPTLTGSTGSGSVVLATGATVSNLSSSTPATIGSMPVLLSQLSTGWIPDTNTWTYASASTFTVPTDQTELYVPGLKIKWTDSGGVKYGVVLSAAFGVVTTVTILVNTSYVIANSAITAPSFSFGANPVGFPNAFSFGLTVAAITPGGTPPTWSFYGGTYYTLGRRIFYTLNVQVNAAGTGSGGISFGGFPTTIVSNDGPGICKENAVAGIMGVLIGGTSVFNLQTYSGGNPIVNSYAWLCQVNTYF